MIDCGANVDARPAHLLQFAKMGFHLYGECSGIKDPKVGIVNIGAEEERRAMHWSKIHFTVKRTSGN